MVIHNRSGGLIELNEDAAETTRNLTRNELIPASPAIRQHIILHGAKNVRTPATSHVMTFEITSITS